MKKGFKVLFVIFALLLSFNVVSAKSKACTIVDGAYYGKDAKEVDKVQYEKECVSHSCEIVGDTYFGKDGKEVTQGTFENQCNVTVVSELPDTASSSDLILIIIGGSLILGSIIVSISYRLASDRA